MTLNEIRSRSTAKKIEYFQKRNFGDILDSLKHNQQKVIDEIEKVKQEQERILAKLPE